MAKAIWTQYRAFIQVGYITINLDTALDDEGWSDFETAYKQYKLYKSTGMNAKMQMREVTFGALKEDEIENIHHNK